MTETVKISDDLIHFDRFWNFSNPNQTELTFRSLLSDADHLTGRDRCHLIELWTQIARAQGLQGKLKDAEASLKQAETLLASDVQTYRVSSRIRYLLEKGRLNILERTPSQARTAIAEAWTLASNSGEDYYAIDAAQLMAAIEPQKVQTSWLLRALEICEKSPQPRAKEWLSSLYVSLGWKHFELRHYDEALNFFQKSLSHLKAEGDERKVIESKWAVGKVLRAMNKTEEALTLQTSLVAELQSMGIQDGRVFEELAECLQTLKRPTEAQPYFELAYRELVKDVWSTDNRAEQMKRMKELGKVKG